MLVEAAREGRLNAGTRLLLVGFGTGYSVGLADMTWPAHFEACST